MNPPADEAALRQAICEAGRWLYTRGLVAATDGNLSARLGEDTFLCTPSGVSKGAMAPEDLLVADAAGAQVRGAGKVTSEFFTHLAFYAERSDIAAVVHAHPPHATALTFAGIDLTEPVSPDLALYFGGVPTAPYATPGTREGGAVLRGLAGQADAILLERHGAVTAGPTVLAAYRKMEKLEACAQILWQARALGPLRRMTSDELARVRAARAAYGVAGRIYPAD